MEGSTSQLVVSQMPNGAPAVLQLEQDEVNRKVELGKDAFGWM